MKNDIPHGRILSCDVDGSNLLTIVDNITTAPDGLAIAEGKIFYTNMGSPPLNNGFISSIDIDGKNQKIIVPEGITWTPKQLVACKQTRKIYWCDREGMRVFRCNFDGSDVEILVRSGQSDEDRKDQMHWCVGLAVDSKRRILYWTQKGPSKGNKGRLFSAGLDLPSGEAPDKRSDVKVLLEHLPEPIDLDIDLDQNWLYMSDRGDPPFGNTINKIQLGVEGGLHKEILIRKLHEAIGLSLDIPNQKMYFTDLLGGLYSANLDGSQEKVIFGDLGDLTGVTCVSA